MSRWPSEGKALPFFARVVPCPVWPRQCASAERAHPCYNTGPLVPSHGRSDERRSDAMCARSYTSSKFDGRTSLCPWGTRSVAPAVRGVGGPSLRRPLRWEYWEESTEYLIPNTLSAAPAWGARRAEWILRFLSPPLTKSKYAPRFPPGCWCRGPFSVQMQSKTRSKNRPQKEPMLDAKSAPKVTYCWNKMQSTILYIYIYITQRHAFRRRKRPK